MTIDSPGAIQTYTAIARSSQQAEQSRQDRNNALAAVNATGTQVSLSREALQTQQAEQLSGRERVKEQENTESVRDTESAPASRNESAPDQGGVSNTRQAIAAYRETAQV